MVHNFEVLAITVVICNSNSITAFLWGHYEHAYQILLPNGMEITTCIGYRVWE